jgi:hypothetical protein
VIACSQSFRFVTPAFIKNGYAGSPSRFALRRGANFVDGLIRTIELLFLA